MREACSDFQYIDSDFRTMEHGLQICVLDLLVLYLSAVAVFHEIFDIRLHIVFVQ